MGKNHCPVCGEETEKRICNRCKKHPQKSTKHLIANYWALMGIISLLNDGNKDLTLELNAIDDKNVQLTEQLRTANQEIKRLKEKLNVLVNAMNQSTEDIRFHRLEALTHGLIRVVQDSMAELTIGAYGLERKEEFINEIAKILKFLTETRGKAKEIPFQ